MSENNSANEPAQEFRAVFEDELREIGTRRGEFVKTLLPHDSSEPGAVKENLVGLALSGGGIRSATFGLGLLQELKQKGLLQVFDYLSTVSGGGYVGGWWSAWLSRPERVGEKAKKLPGRLFPPDEKTELARAKQRNKRRESLHLMARTSSPKQHPPAPDREAGAGGEAADHKPEGAESAGVDPLHHLRQYANYLTPRKGGFSQDTWRAVTVITRNLLMTWMVLLPIIVGLVLVGQLYFVLHTQQAKDFIFYPGEEDLAPDALENFAKDRWDNEVIEEDKGFTSLDRVLTPPLATDLRQKLKQEWKAAHKGYLEEHRKRLKEHNDSLEKRDEEDWLLGRPLLTIASQLWMQDFIADLQRKETHQEILRRRMWIAAEPLIAIAGWIALMACLWLLLTLRVDRPRSEEKQGEERRGRSSLSSFLVIITSLVSAAAVVGIMLTTYAEHFAGLNEWLMNPDNRGWQILWLIVALWLLFYAWQPWGPKRSAGDSASRGQAKEWNEDDQRRYLNDTRRSRVNIIHTRLLMLLVAMALVMAVAGFGHEVIKLRYSGVLGSAKNGIGLVVLLATLAGVIFTVYQTRPRGGSDKREQGRPSTLSRVVFAVTPWLVVMVIAFTAAWVGHGVVADMWRHHLRGEDPPLIRYANYVSALAIALCFILALFEMEGRPKRSSDWLKLALLVSAAVVLIGSAESYRQIIESPSGMWLIVMMVLVCLLGVIFIVLKVLELAPKRVSRDKATARPGVAAGQNPAPSPATGDRPAEATAAAEKPRLHPAWNFISQVMIILFYSYWLLVQVTGWLQGFYNLTLMYAATLAGGVILFRLLITRDAGGKGKFCSSIFHKTPEAGQDEDEKLADWNRRLGLYKTSALCCVLAITVSCAISAFHYSLDRELKKDLDTTVSQPDNEGEWFEKVNLFELLSNTLVPKEDRDQYKMYMALPPATGFAVICVFSLVSLWGNSATRGRRERQKSLWQTWRAKFSLAKRGELLGLFLFGIFGLTYMVVMIVEVAHKVHILDIKRSPLILVGIVLCLVFTHLEMEWGDKNNRRSVGLLGFAYLVLIALLIHNLIEEPNLHYRYEYGFGMFGLLVSVCTWLIGIGWLANPNVFSMHNFYKWRLVRAYLGASNQERRAVKKDITEAAPKDDVLLHALKNCQRGAPYHLINTTLNLVAGRDLAIAQRSADSFLLSKNYCGSLRTSYRLTQDYMGGELSLGTAIAISGAAASPNMGSHTPTSALAMLMTLLNVRLGYWVPTPNQEDWRLPRPRLWPFYLIREFFSQTNDLSSFCYLTDGGHFDNTGIYPLVMRGCRYIVAADCGADPRHSFTDLGDVIRLCRIDFGAEIELDLGECLIPAESRSSRLVSKHCMVGRITYSKEHLRMLWCTCCKCDQQSNNCNCAETCQCVSKAQLEGIIIVFKPSLTKEDKADVRQYALENPAFPHTTTANQWFDESQFESYRRLGQICAHSLFNLFPLRAPVNGAQEEKSNDGAISICELFQNIYKAYHPKEPLQSPCRRDLKADARD